MIFCGRSSGRPPQFHPFFFRLIICWPKDVVSQPLSKLGIGLAKGMCALILGGTFQESVSFGHFSLFLPIAWNVEAMAGARAAILDHEMI